MTGTISRISNSFGNGFVARVRPYDKMMYFGYTLREAKKRYRVKYGLVGKRIEWG